MSKSEVTIEKPDKIVDTFDEILQFNRQNRNQKGEGQLKTAIFFVSNKNVIQNNL